jgi:hypothetical protein
MKGMILQEQFITENEESLLIKSIDSSNKWAGNGIYPNPELRRRTLQFGFLFEYKSRKVLGTTDPIPDIFNPIIKKLIDNGFFSQSTPPNHLLINEYNINQGIMYINANQGHTLIPQNYLARLSLLFLCFQIV